MKRGILIAVWIATVCSAVAADFEAPLERGRSPAAVPDETLVERPRFRLLDVLQMFNPFAPRAYGGGDHALVYKEEDEDLPRTQAERRGRGFRLISITIW